MDRKTFRDADILILTSSEITARFSPFASTEIVINTTTRQIKKGPGRWDDLTMVLDLSLPDASEILALESLRLAGDGSGLSQRWLRTGDLNGKAKYVDTGSTDRIYWSSGKWYIEKAAAHMFESTENVATPDLVMIWEPVGLGIPPAPLITRITADTLQQVLEALSMDTQLLRAHRPNHFVIDTATDGAQLKVLTAGTVGGDATVDFGEYSTVQLISAIALDTESMPGRKTGGMGGQMVIYFANAAGDPLGDDTPVVITAVCVP